MQKAVFDLPCDEQDFQAAPSSLRGQWSLKKRLQRARKYVFLVSIFGTSILLAAPEVAVTRVDGLRLTDLCKLAKGGTASGLVEDIVRQIRSQPVKPACLEGHIQEAICTTIAPAESPTIFRPPALTDGP